MVIHYIKDTVTNHVIMVISLKITGKCECGKGWGHAGFTDTIDWFKGECNQFKCQSNNQCKKLASSCKKSILSSKRMELLLSNQYWT